MTVNVIGLGLGRTGTYSLKLAIERLGFGPCHHMEVVLQNMPAQVPLWNAALAGHPDWAAIYEGFSSAVDWPTAGFVRELAGAFPSAKFLLTHRDHGTWADSFGETIYKLLAGRDQAPPAVKDWLDMAARVVIRSGFAEELDRDGLIKAFNAHNDMVKRTIPADRLLVYQVKEGWEPLCAFLGVPVPDEAFPRTNDRAEFWELVNGSL